MTNRTLIGALALLMSWPAAAQQAAPAMPTPAAPMAPPGAMGGMGMMGGQGPGMMMGGQAPGRAGAQAPGMGGMMMMGGDADEDDDPRPMHRRHHSGRRDAPVQIIINIGPDNRVEVGDQDPRGQRRGEPGWMGRTGPMGDHAGVRPAELVDTHLDRLRQALQLRPDQQPGWDRFAGAVRDAAGRMMRAQRGALSQAQGLEERVASYEAALASRLEAVRSLRGALAGLSGSLDETQRRLLDESAAGFMGMGRMGGYGR